MRKIKKGILFISLISFLFMPIVQAASSCDYETQVQLKKEASNVNGVYEIARVATGEMIESDEIDEDGNINNEMVEEYKDVVQVNIYNITENLYITILNESTNVEETVYYSDLEDGVYSFTRDNLDEIVSYRIKVFSNHPSCVGEEYANFEIKTPMFNAISTFEVCDRTNVYYCQEYITEKIDMTDEEIYNKMEELQDKLLAEQNDNNENKDTSFWNKYGIYFIVGICVIGIGVIIVFILSRIRRRQIL